MVGLVSVRSVAGDFARWTARAKELPRPIEGHRPERSRIGSAVMCAKRSHPPDSVSSPLILFVDDFEDARDLYAEYFVFRGFRVALSSNGADAIAKARELAPAVVVMDLRMPGMDGWEATRQLKSDARTATIPVVALTAHAFMDVEVRARQAGCDDVIIKPCLPEELLVRVEKTLKGRRYRKPQPA